MAGYDGMFLRWEGTRTLKMKDRYLTDMKFCCHLKYVYRRGFFKLEDFARGQFLANLLKIQQQQLQRQVARPEHGSSNTRTFLNRFPPVCNP